MEALWDSFLLHASFAPIRVIDPEKDSETEVTGEAPVAIAFAPRFWKKEKKEAIIDIIIAVFSLPGRPTSGRKAA